jgi:glycosyltransferase involved in cell wall biosynthesis
LTERRPRVAIVVTHPIQHFCPLYRALASTGRVDLRVFFASDAGARAFFDADYGQNIHFQSDLLSGFEYEFLPGFTHELTHKVANPHVGERLDEFRPDVVQVYGYHHSISTDAMRWARGRGKPVLYCSDSELRSPRKFLTRAVKALVLPRILRQCDGFLTIGDCNEEYLRRYGVPSERFYRSPIPIDDARLTAALVARSDARKTLLQRFGLPSDAIMALAVGKLMARKAIDHAVRAVAATWDQGWKNRLFLILAGSGPEQGRLEALARSLHPDSVRFAGFVEVEQLPGYYCGADFLVHPAESDPHPLATGEAVFCGLPVIASDRIGSIGPTDDVRPKMNGMEYPYGDVDALSAHLRYLCERPEERERMRQNSLEIGRRRSLGASVDGFLRAVEAVDRGNSSSQT